MRKVTAQISLLGIFLSFIFPLSCQLLNKQGCKTTSSCFSKPPSCTSSNDCDYLLKYSLDGKNVIFELSSKQYEWVAVGFNDKRAMIGGKSLVCETHGSKVLLNHYDMPSERYPDLSKETNASILSNQSSGGVLYCKFSREQDQGSGRFNLSNPVYFLYAGGMMESGNLVQHLFVDSSSQLVNLNVMTDNSISKGTATKIIDTAECGKTKSCLRQPESCKDNTNCNYLVTFQKNGSAIEFSVSGKADGWISVGFNNKPKMGNTDCVICQGGSANVTLWASKLTYSSPNLKESNEIKLLDGENKGGFIYCKFSRPLKPKSNKMLDIGVLRYIIYAKGSGTGSINKHKGSGSKGCSEIKVDFSSNKIYKLDDCHGDDISKVHGSLMIFSWMFLVVISVFIARYSRPLWRGMKIKKENAWFQLHRLIMGLAVLFTVISIIIIFVHKEGWSESAGDHAVFGIIVLILALIQPTVAFFRPHPENRWRFIFNWFHRFIALLLIIMSVVSVFKGTYLVEDYGGDVASKILIVLLVVTLVTAFILEILALRVRIKKNDYTIDPQPETMDVEYPVANTIWEVKVQRVLLIVVSLVVFVLSVAMIAYVAGAGMED